LSCRTGATSASWKRNYGALNFEKKSSKLHWAFSLARCISSPACNQGRPKTLGKYIAHPTKFQFNMRKNAKCSAMVFTQDHFTWIVMVKASGVSRLGFLRIGILEIFLKYTQP